MSEQKIAIRFDSQILNNLEACHRKLKYASIVGYVPERKAEPLSKGTLVHDGLKSYYKAIMSGVSKREAIDAMVETVRKKSLSSDLPIPNCEEIVTTLVQYGQYRISDSWVPLAIEEPFSYVFFENDQFQILHEGIVDAIIADINIKMAVVDHKTSSRRGTVSSMSNQFKGYAKAFNSPHVIVNKIGFQKTLPVEEKFSRQLLSYTPSVIEEWVNKAIRKISEYGAKYGDAEWMDEANETSCDKFSGCIYRWVCEQSPDVRDTLLVQNFRIRGAWDPFKRDEDDE